MVVEGAPESIFIHVDRKFVFLNQEAVKLFGAKSYDELIGTSIMDRFHPNDRKAVEQRIANSLKGLENPPHNATTYFKMDGTKVYVERNPG